jgi:hypothetical protein
VKLGLLLALALLAAPASTEARGGSGRGHSRAVAGVKRDRHGRIARSEAARLAFMRATGFPKGRPGYVVDHIVPLYRGGADTPSNMQWETLAEAKAKDRWE